MLRRIRDSKLGAVAPRHAAWLCRAAHLGKGSASPSRCIPSEQGAFRGPRAPQRPKGLAPWNPRQAFTPDTTTKNPARFFDLCPTVRRLNARSGTFAFPPPNDQRRSALDRKPEEPCSSDTASVGLSRPTPRPNRAPVGCAATACPVASTARRALLPRHPQRQAFAPDTTTTGVPPLDTRPTVRRLDMRQRAPLDPARRSRRAMTETPGSASSEETRGGAPEIIYLPDQRQRTKKVTSGSGNRRRKNVERFRTDDAEHLALEALVQANGGSLGAYVMQLAAIDSDIDSRPRLNRRPVSVDTAALTRALVELNRVGNNLNQIARALNELALIAHEQSSRRLELRIEELAAAISSAPDALAVPLAAIQAALSRDREG